MGITIDQCTTAFELDFDEESIVTFFNLTLCKTKIDLTPEQALRMCDVVTCFDNKPLFRQIVEQVYASIRGQRPATICKLLNIVDDFTSQERKRNNTFFTW